MNNLLLNSYYINISVLKMHSLNNDAGIDIIIGPMFSGKSTELLRRLITASDVGFNVLYINHSLDTRNPDSVFSTHNPFTKTNISHIDKIVMLKTDALENVNLSEIDKYDIIGIDEGQFFNDIGIVNTWVFKMNKRVIIASLDGDYNSNIFGSVLTLVPKCNSIVKLHAYCSICSKSKILKPAYFTHLYQSISSNVHENSNPINIGASDKYEPLCLQCYKKESNS